MRTNLIDMKIRSMNINILVIEKNLGYVFSKFEGKNNELFGWSFI